jgi:hypothetical protein
MPVICGVKPSLTAKPVIGLRIEAGEISNIKPYGGAPYPVALREGDSLGGCLRGLVLVVFREFITGDGSTNDSVEGLVEATGVLGGFFLLLQEVNDHLLWFPV